MEALSRLCLIRVLPCGERGLAELTLSYHAPSFAQYLQREFCTPEVAPPEGETGPRHALRCGPWEVRFTVQEGGDAEEEGGLGRPPLLASFEDVLPGEFSYRVTLGDGGEGVSVFLPLHQLEDLQAALADFHELHSVCHSAAAEHLAAAQRAGAIVAGCAAAAPSVSADLSGAEAHLRSGLPLLVPALLPPHALAGTALECHEFQAHTASMAVTVLVEYMYAA
ncbi:hypothetical protein B484DRAFT_52063 [Ochromonadaceae sp. CCMP2298]|nr:hypothetical protein B484DRAFT_52063 [Ochromonadaceae sp. CCMP2298]